MIESKIYIGLNDVNTNTQLFENEKYIKGIRNVCYSHRGLFLSMYRKVGTFMKTAKKNYQKTKRLYTIA